MACLYPKIAYYDTRVNPPRVFFKPHDVWARMDALPDGVTSIAIPCGKCFACLKARALALTVRSVAESRMHFESSFLTLTVDDDHLADVFPQGLCHRPWQLFAKRLRKAIGSFTFLMCGEYGARTCRPHYHACIFGRSFDDGYFDPRVGMIASRTLRECWPYGNHMVSPLNPSRAAYVAGYTCKDYALGRDDKWYVDRGLGLPYVKWSRRPALGLRWLQCYYKDLIDDDFNFSFVIDGRPFNFGCRYFSEKFRLLLPAEYDRLVASRRDRLRNVDAITGIMRHEDLVRRCELKQYQIKKKKESADL